MKITGAMIDKVLIAGIIIAAIFVSYGGIKYLVLNGANPFISTHFKIDVGSCSLCTVGKNLTKANAFACIFVGVIVLFITQLSRVAMIAIIFWQNKEFKLGLISICVFGMLLCCAFANIL